MRAADETHRRATPAAAVGRIERTEKSYTSDERPAAVSILHMAIVLSRRGSSRLAALQTWTFLLHPVDPGLGKLGRWDESPVRSVDRENKLRDRR